MKPSTPSRRPVDVFADMIVASPAGRLTVKGAGQSVAVSAGGWRVYRELATSLRRRSRVERHRIFTRLGHILESTGLELRFQIDDREIARLGGAGTGWVARGLAMPGMRIRFGQLLAARFRALAKMRLTA